MNQRLFKTLIFSTAILGTTSMFSAIQAQTAETHAEVLNVEELTEMVEGSREVCEDVVTTEPAQAKDKKKITGTAIGAVAGGLLGNTIGGGTGKTLATIAGAVSGGYAGNKVQGNAQDGKTVTKTDQKCRIETSPTESVVGYNVTYRLDGKATTVRTNFKPVGDTIPVKDGKLVFEH